MSTPGIALLLCALALGLQVAAAANREASTCSLGIAESMPDKLELDSLTGVAVTHESLIDMINKSQRTLRIASFYLMLTPQEDEYASHPSAEPGARVRDALKAAGERGVSIEVVLDDSQQRPMHNPADIAYLEPHATFHLLNMKRLEDSGVQHSKILIADNSSFYLGSSNFDWRSYTQVKEIGLTGRECPEIAQDLDRIFRTFVLMSRQEKLPEDSQVLTQFATKINMRVPLETNGLQVFLGAAPPSFFPSRETNRTDDIEGLLHVIDSAKETLDISVMNYSPRFYWPRVYWPVIDDALRRAATERNVRVRLLFSDWQRTKPLDLVWLRSLNAIQAPELRKGGIHVKLFKVPAYDQFQESLPYARVKHDKYMLSDQALFVGTSNWTPDYFKTTCGVGMVLEGEAKVVQTMREIFERDFNSKFAHEM